MKEETVFGRAFAEDEVRSMISGAESPLDVKARIGEPVVDFGPQRVFVYVWTVKKGYFAWIVGGGQVSPEV